MGGLQTGSRKSRRPWWTPRYVWLWPGCVCCQTPDRSCWHPGSGILVQLPGHQGSHWAGWHPVPWDWRAACMGLLAPGIHSGSEASGGSGWCPQECPHPGQPAQQSRHSGGASSKDILPSSFPKLCQGQTTHCADWWHQCLGPVGSSPAVPQAREAHAHSPALPLHGCSSVAAPQGISHEGSSSLPFGPSCVFSCMHVTE